MGVGVQVASMFETVDKAKKETTMAMGTSRRGGVRRGQSSGHALGQTDNEEMSSIMHKTVIIKKSNGDEPVVKVGQAWKAVHRGSCSYA